MFIAHIAFTVAPSAVTQALGTLLAEAAAIRQMPGCIAFVPFHDPSVDGGLGVLHEWETADAFAAYLASPGFATLNTDLRPMMVNAPVSRRFDANLIKSTN